MTRTIYLSSNPASAQINYNTVYLSDISTVYLNVTGVNLTKPPVNIKISWGDESPIETYSNNFFTSEIDPVKQALYGFNYSIVELYSHSYDPSSSSLTKNLTCQALVTYFDGTSCRFVQPITIYSPSFYNRIADLSLIQNNIVDNSDSVLFTFQSQKDGYILESLYTPTSI